MIFLPEGSFWSTFFKMAHSNYKKEIFKDEPIVCFHQSTPQSLAGKYMLNEYFRRLEANANAGLRECDYHAIIKEAKRGGSIECYYCKAKENPDRITFDHIIPYFFGGKSQFANLRLSCEGCNLMKGSIHHQTMPVCWEIFNRNLDQGIKSFALDILKEALTMNLCEVEKHLCLKLYQKRWSGERIEVPKILLRRQEFRDFFN